jgi:fatty acid-binding protein DegV
VFVAHQGPPGRLPDAAGWAVLEFVDGAARPIGVRDNIGEAIDAMLASVLAGEPPLRAAVGHAGAPTEPAADALALSLAGASQIVKVERYRVGAAVGAHTGPLSFGAFWWPAP